MNVNLRGAIVDDSTKGRWTFGTFTGLAGEGTFIAQKK